MIPVPSSPDIASIDFAVLFDISTVVPTVTLTNGSTGSNLAGCTWWYEIITPSGTYMHQGTQGTSDASGNWTTLTSNTWPQPFGQIEWSGSNYAVILYVLDAHTHIYQLRKEIPIRRPQGSTPQAKNNFAAPAKETLYVETRCNDAKMYVADQINYAYEGEFGTSVAKTFTVDYPLDITGTRPAPYVVTDFNNALVPMPYSGYYNLFLSSKMRYDFPDGISIQLIYKVMQAFNVWCNVDLCPLLCSYNDLVEKVKRGDCKNGSQAEWKDKLVVITGLITQAMLLKIQPNCGNKDLPALIEEIKCLGEFDCNCFATGINETSSLEVITQLNFETCGNIQVGHITTDDAGMATIPISVTGYDFATTIGGVTDNGFTGVASSIDCNRVITFNIDANNATLGFFRQTGNTFGASAIIGTKDNFGLFFRTNNVNKASLAATGQFALFAGADEAVESISNTGNANKLFIGIGVGNQYAANTAFFSLGTTLSSANPSIGITAASLNVFNLGTVYFNNASGIMFTAQPAGTNTNMSLFGLASSSNSSGSGMNATTGILNWLTLPLNSGTNSQFNPASGNAVFNMLNIDAVINGSGSFTGQFVDINLNPQFVGVDATNDKYVGIKSTSIYGAFLRQEGTAKNSLHQLHLGSINSYPGAVLSMDSTTQAVLFPRMTQTQRDAITGTTDGMMIYQTDNTPGFYKRAGGSWSII